MKFLQTVMAAMVFTVMLMSTPANADDGALSTIDPDYFTVKPEWQADPAVAWATPLAGGPLRTVVIGAVSTGSELAQLARRLEMDAEVVVVKPTIGLPEGVIGYPLLSEGHYNNVKGFSHVDMTAKLLAALQADCELILIGNVDWSILPDEVQKRIATKVTEGAGLVLAHQSSESVDFWRKRLTDPAVKPIAPSTLPLAQVRERIIKELPEAAREADGRLAGDWGKGRVVLLQWAAPSDTAIGLIPLIEHAFTGLWPLCESTRDGWSYEYELAAVIDSALWAAGRDGPSRLTAISVPESATTEDEFTVTASIDLPSGVSNDFKLVWQVRGTSNEVVRQGELAVSAADDTVELSMEPLAPAGVYGIDLRLMRDGAVVDFAGAVVQTTSGWSIAELKLEAAKGMPGETIRGGLRLNGSFSAADSVRLEVIDPWDRLLTAQVFKIDAAGEVAFTLEPIESLSGHNEVRATLLVDQQEVDRAATGYIVDRRDITRDDYQFVAWHTLPADYLAAERVAQLNTIGFDVLYHPHYYEYPTEYLRRGSWATARGGLTVAPYIWRDYAYAKQDVRDLHRDPCLSSPAYHAAMRQRLTPYVQLASEFAAPHASLGDEPYLVHFWDGVDGRDVCFAPDCVASLRKYLQDKYASIESLNEAWGTGFEGWPQVEPMIYQDAVAHGNLSPWIDHRQHMT